MKRFYVARCLPAPAPRSSLPRSLHPGAGVPLCLSEHLHHPLGPLRLGGWTNSRVISSGSRK